MNLIASFLGSNTFVGIATLIVGGVALYVYLKQRMDYKRDAASTIVMELRYAESMINKLRSLRDYNNTNVVILPTNNWVKNSHLFIKDLTSDQLELINSFYSFCSNIDKALNTLDFSSQFQNKSQSVYSVLAQLANSESENAQYDQKRKKFIDRMNVESWLFLTQGPVDDIKKALGDINFVMTSTAGSVLMSIAKMDVRKGLFNKFVSPLLKLS